MASGSSGRGGGGRGGRGTRTNRQTDGSAIERVSGMECFDGYAVLSGKEVKVGRGLREIDVTVNRI